MIPFNSRFKNPGNEYPNYSGMSVLNHNGVGPIYTFNDIKFGNNKQELNFSGEWMIIPRVGFYSHFLQEIVGSFLYYKKYINPNVKILIINNPISYDGNDMDNLVDSVFSILPKDQSFILDDWQLKNISIKIDKLVTFWYSSRFYPNFDIKSFIFYLLYQNNNDKINPLLRNFFSEYLVKDDSMPKKIFLSRRKRNAVMEEMGHADKLDFRYSPAWYHDAVEDFFKSLGYQIVELSGMKIEEQIKYFFNADHIAGIAGANLLNGIFASEGSDFIEILDNYKYHYDHRRDTKSTINVRWNQIQLYAKENYNQVFNDLKRKYDRLDPNESL